jgi:hypothetical protein
MMLIFWVSWLGKDIRHHAVSANTRPCEWQMQEGRAQRSGFLRFGEAIAYAVSTTRTSIATLSQFRIALKIAARLSMLGLPLGDSIRCRLLLGL